MKLKKRLFSVFIILLISNNFLFASPTKTLPKKNIQQPSNSKQLKTSQENQTQAMEILEEMLGNKQSRIFKKPTEDWTDPTKFNTAVSMLENIQKTIIKKMDEYNKNQTNEELYRKIKSLRDQFYYLVNFILEKQLLHKITLNYLKVLKDDKLTTKNIKYLIRFYIMANDPNFSPAEKSLETKIKLLELGGKPAYFKGKRLWDEIIHPSNITIKNINSLLESAPIILALAIINKFKEEKIKDPIGTSSKIITNLGFYKKYDPNLDVEEIFENNIQKLIDEKIHKNK